MKPFGKVSSQIPTNLITKRSIQTAIIRARFSKEKKFSRHWLLDFKPSLDNNHD